MVSSRHARVFCETSMWMAVPLVSALQNGKLFLAGALMLTTFASMQHWRWLIHSHEAHVVWQNLDRVGVLLVLSQVNKVFWPFLALLFAIGAKLQSMRVKTYVWGGGAGKVSREILPFRAQRWHFWCHVLCRYVAFWACCLASGHVVTTWPDTVRGRFWQWVQMFQIIIYSTLYLVHIHAILVCHMILNNKSRDSARAITNWCKLRNSVVMWQRRLRMRSAMIKIGGFGYKN